MKKNRRVLKLRDRLDRFPAPLCDTNCTQNDNCDSFRWWHPIGIVHRTENV